jgi:hypothetical protein
MSRWSIECTTRCALVTIGTEFRLVIAWAILFVMTHSQSQDTLPEGATLVPILLGSDATHLTNFAGDKKAWPVYMSLGNIHSKIRNNPSKKAWRLIAYIPVVNWLDVDTIRTTLQNRLYHECMEFVLQSLINPGLHGVDICDSKGDTRHSYLRIAAHLADLPEQSLIACATRLPSAVPTTYAGMDSFQN